MKRRQSRSAIGQSASRPALDEISNRETFSRFYTLYIYIGKNRLVSDVSRFLVSLSAIATRPLRCAPAARRLSGRFASLHAFTP